MTPSGAVHNSLSVNINLDANLHRSQSAIKLTFSSTINGQSQSQQMTPISDRCKSELDATTPGPDINNPQTSEFPAAAAAGDPIDSEYLDELTDLLDKLEEDPRCFDAPAVDSISSVERSAGLATRPPVYPPSYCAATAFPSPASTEAAPGCVGLMGGTVSAPTLLGDTGPAAETLKQMAAQHQSLHENSSVGRHFVYPDGYHQAATGFRGPVGPVRMPRYRAVLAGGPYVMASDPSPACHVDPRTAGYGPVYPGDAVQYRASAARSQHQRGVTSSLQRLETQVRSQFAPSTDSQQQQQQQLRLEQSQRVDVRAPGQVLVARQQQSFVMSMDAHQQQQPAPPQRAYLPPAIYQQYPDPVGYRMTAGPSGTVPAGYGGMPGRVPQQPAARVHPSYAGLQSHHDQASSSSSVAGGPSNTGRVHPGRGALSTSSGQQLPTKVEAGVVYPADTGGVNGIADVPASANYVTMSHAKLTHPQQRPPNVTVVPGPPASAMNFHPHAGVKWMPARHPYAGGYDAASVRQADNSPAGWSLSMSQTQSLYMSAGDVPYHAAGYPAAGTVQTAAPDQSRHQRIASAVPGDVVFQRPAAAAPGQVYVDAFPSAYSGQDFAFTDAVYVSKQ